MKGSDELFSDEALFNSGLCWLEGTGQTVNNLSVHRCIVCGKEVVSTEDYSDAIIPCNNPMSVAAVRELNGIKLPGIVQRLGNFGVAYLRHKLSGAQERDKEAICEFFAYCFTDQRQCISYEEGTCLECGCAVNTKMADEGLNKIAWSETQCPRGYWP